MRAETKISKQISNDVENVINFVSKYFQVSNLKSRKGLESNARRCIVGLLKERYCERVSYKYIALKLGYSNASCAINANKRCLELKRFDKDFSMTYQIISSLCLEE